MLFPTTAALLALLPALGAAICTRCKSEGASLQSTSDTGANDCGESSFTKLTQSNRPLVTDCQTLSDNLWESKSWEVTTGGVTVASYRSCAFNAISFGGNSLIGNEDIKDLIRDSIARYQDSGYVGAQGSYNMYIAAAGSVPCTAATSTDRQVKVDWTLSHP